MPASPPARPSRAGEDTDGRALIVVLLAGTVVGVPLAVGVLIMAVVAAGAMLIALNAQQVALDCTTGQYGDGNVPLPVTDPEAPLTVKVATWNVHRHNTTSNIVRGVQAIGASGADVVGLQELTPESRRRSVYRQLGGMWAFSAGNNAVPLAWRKNKYDLLAQGNEKQFGEERIEKGAAGVRVGPKYLQWVQLRDRRTGAVFFVGNDHKVPTVERRGHPIKTKVRGLRLYRTQMRVEARVVTRLSQIAPFIKTGDENLDAKADARVRSPMFRYVAAAKYGLYSNWRVLGYPDGGTHASGRRIDYVSATTAQIAPVAQRLLGRYSSDHRAVLVDLNNAPARTRLNRAQNRNLAIVKRPTPDPTQDTYDETRRQQIVNARLVERGVRAAGGTGRAVYVALVAAVGESDLINLGYGDQAGPDSRGVFQQRKSWGTLAHRMDPGWAAGAFMLGPHQGGSGGLLQLPGWEALPVTTAIHRVQINADPSHYTRFEARAREIGQQAGIDFDAPAGPPADTAITDATCAVSEPVQTSPAGIGTGLCPLDQLHAPGKENPSDCNAALTFMTQEMTGGSRAWKRQCMALVAVAYGWRYSGNATAYIGAQRVIAAGKMSTDRTNIPQGAVMWWDGRPTGNTAGHVAIYDGDGHILSNDVPVTDGRVGRVPWTYPETNWGHTWLGWSPPYLPNAG